MPMSQYPLDLWVVLILFLQFLGVSKALLFSREEGFEGLGGVGFPDPNVSVLTSGDDVSIVHRVQDRVHLLHTLCVVHLTGTTGSKGENPDCLVE